MVRSQSSLSRSWSDEQNVLRQILVLSRNCKYKVNSFPANIQFGLSRILEVGQVNEGEQVGQVPRGELAKNPDYAQNPLAAAHRCALGANRRRKLALWPGYAKYVKARVIFGLREFRDCPSLVPDRELWPHDHSRTRVTGAPGAKVLESAP
jgi:hypothetical protein